MKPSTKIRLNADLSPDVAKALKDLADKQGVSLTEALSRAISTEATLVAKRKKGARVLVQEGSDMTELVFTRDLA